MPDYDNSDIQRRIYQINKDPEIDDFQKDRKKQALHTVYQFCVNEIDCRRTLILNHFTEKFDPASCQGTCDNCASTDEVTDVDLTNHAVLYVNMFEELENRHMKITGPQSTNAFRGTQKQEMARKSFDTLGNFAKGSNLSVDLVKRLLDHLAVHRILITDVEEQPDPARPPISYLYVPTFFFTPVMLRLTRLFAARAQGKGISEQAIRRLADSLRKERYRRSEVQEGFTAAGPCFNRLDQEEAHTIGRRG